MVATSKHARELEDAVTQTLRAEPLLNGVLVVLKLALHKQGVARFVFHSEDVSGRAWALLIVGFKKLLDAQSRSGEPGSTGTEPMIVDETLATLADVERLAAASVFEDAHTLWGQRMAYFEMSDKLVTSLLRAFVSVVVKPLYGRPRSPHLESFFQTFFTAGELKTLADEGLNFFRQDGIGKQKVRQFFEAVLTHDPSDLLRHTIPEIAQVSIEEESSSSGESSLDGRGTSASPMPSPAPIGSATSGSAAQQVVDGCSVLAVKAWQQAAQLGTEGAWEGRQLVAGGSASAAVAHGWHNMHPQMLGEGTDGNVASKMAMPIGGVAQTPRGPVEYMCCPIWVPRGSTSAAGDVNTHHDGHEQLTPEHRATVAPTDNSSLSNVAGTAYWHGWQHGAYPWCDATSLQPGTYNSFPDLHHAFGLAAGESLTPVQASAHALTVTPRSFMQQEERREAQSAADDDEATQVLSYKEVCLQFSRMEIGEEERAIADEEWSPRGAFGSHSSESVSQATTSPFFFAAAAGKEDTTAADSENSRMLERMKERNASALQVSRSSPLFHGRARFVSGACSDSGRCWGDDSHSICDSDIDMEQSVCGDECTKARCDDRNEDRGSNSEASSTDASSDCATTRIGSDFVPRCSTPPAPDLHTADEACPTFSSNMQSTADVQVQREPLPSTGMDDIHITPHEEVDKAYLPTASRDDDPFIKRSAETSPTQTPAGDSPSWACVVRGDANARQAQPNRTMPAARRSASVTWQPVACGAEAPTGPSAKCAGSSPLQGPTQPSAESHADPLDSEDGPGGAEPHLPASSPDLTPAPASSSTPNRQSQGLDAKDGAPPGEDMRPASDDGNGPLPRDAIPMTVLSSGTRARHGASQPAQHLEVQNRFATLQSSENEDEGKITTTTHSPSTEAAGALAGGDEDGNEGESLDEDPAMPDAALQSKNSGESETARVNANNSQRAMKRAAQRQRRREKRASTAAKEASDADVVSRKQGLGLDEASSSTCLPDSEATRVTAPESPASQEGCAVSAEREATLLTKQRACQSEKKAGQSATADGGFNLVKAFHGYSDSRSASAKSSPARRPCANASVGPCDHHAVGVALPDASATQNGCVVTPQAAQKTEVAANATQQCGAIMESLVYSIAGGPQGDLEALSGILKEAGVSVGPETLKNVCKGIADELQAGDPHEQDRFEAAAEPAKKNLRQLGLVCDTASNADSTKAGGAASGQVDKSNDVNAMEVDDESAAPVARECNEPSASASACAKASQDAQSCDPTREYSKTKRATRQEITPKTDESFQCDAKLPAPLFPAGAEEPPRVEQAESCPVTEQKGVDGNKESSCEECPLLGSTTRSDSLCSNHGTRPAERISRTADDSPIAVWRALRDVQQAAWDRYIAEVVFSPSYEAYRVRNEQPTSFMAERPKFMKIVQNLVDTSYTDSSTRIDPFLPFSSARAAASGDTVARKAVAPDEACQPWLTATSSGTWQHLNEHARVDRSKADDLEPGDAMQVIHQSAPSLSLSGVAAGVGLPEEGEAQDSQEDGSGEIVFARWRESFTKKRQQVTRWSGATVEGSPGTSTGETLPVCQKESWSSVDAEVIPHDGSVLMKTSLAVLEWLELEQQLEEDTSKHQDERFLDLSANYVTRVVFPRCREVEVYRRGQASKASVQNGASSGATNNPTSLISRNKSEKSQGKTPAAPAAYVVVASRESTPTAPAFQETTSDLTYVPASEAMQRLHSEILESSEIADKVKEWRSLLTEISEKLALGGIQLSKKKRFELEGHTSSATQEFKSKANSPNERTAIIRSAHPRFGPFKKGTIGPNEETRRLGDRADALQAELAVIFAKAHARMARHYAELSLTTAISREGIAGKKAPEHSGEGASNAAATSRGSSTPAFGPEDIASCVTSYLKQLSAKASRYFQDAVQGRPTLWQELVAVFRPLFRRDADKKSGAFNWDLTEQRLSTSQVWKQLVLEGFLLNTLLLDALDQSAVFTSVRTPPVGGLRRLVAETVSARVEVLSASFSKKEQNKPQQSPGEDKIAPPVSGNDVEGADTSAVEAGEPPSTSATTTSSYVAECGAPGLLPGTLPNFDAVWNRALLRKFPDFYAVHLADAKRIVDLVHNLPSSTTHDADHANAMVDVGGELHLEQLKEVLSKQALLVGFAGEEALNKRMRAFVCAHDPQDVVKGDYGRELGMQYLALLRSRQMFPAVVIPREKVWQMPPRPDQESCSGTPLSGNGASAPTPRMSEQGSKNQGSARGDLRRRLPQPLLLSQVQHHVSLHPRGRFAAADVFSQAPACPEGSPATAAKPVISYTGSILGAPGLRDEQRCDPRTPGSGRSGEHESASASGAVRLPGPARFLNEVPDSALELWLLARELITQAQQDAKQSGSSAGGLDVPSGLDDEEHIQDLAWDVELLARDKRIKRGLDAWLLRRPRVKRMFDDLNAKQLMAVQILARKRDEQAKKSKKENMKERCGSAKQPRQPKTPATTKVAPWASAATARFPPAKHQSPPIVDEGLALLFLHAPNFAAVEKMKKEWMPTLLHICWCVVYELTELRLPKLSGREDPGFDKMHALWWQFVSDYPYYVTTENRPRRLSGLSGMQGQGMICDPKRREAGSKFLLEVQTLQHPADLAWDMVVTEQMIDANCFLFARP
ncbi:unnamed protein product [Amoebophrya sp. A25]|nr:unnamed protein product [Amoebophrya sp. A25]|eukprot:GSA25T00005133001.1